jgi:hypothetical protein
MFERKTKPAINNYDVTYTPILEDGSRDNTIKIDGVYYALTGTVGCEGRLQSIVELDPAYIKPFRRIVREKNRGKRDNPDKVRITVG